MRRWKRDFELLGVLGSGTFGDVSMVRHKLDLQEYALKRVRLPRATLELGFGFASFNGENETWGGGNSDDSHQRSSSGKCTCCRRFIIVTWSVTTERGSKMWIQSGMSRGNVDMKMAMIRTTPCSPHRPRRSCARQAGVSS